MSRLIREEDVLKIIRNGWSNHWSCKEMCEAISDISTAYDVDKVVEQLADEILCDGCSGCTNCFELDKRHECNSYKAIEKIVEAGGAKCVK